MLTDEPTASPITDAVQVSTATTPGADPALQMLMTNTELTKVGYELGKLDEGSYEDFVARARIIAKEEGLTTFLSATDQQSIASSQVVSVVDGLSRAASEQAEASDFLAASVGNLEQISRNLQLSLAH